MKALSLLQPWASLIVAGPKNIENRRWHLPKAMLGETWLVHASARIDRGEIESARRVLEELCEFDESLMQMPDAATFLASDLPLGGIIGIVRSTACLCPSTWGLDMREKHPWWFEGQHGFVLEDRHPLPFVPCKGALGFWTVPDDVLRQLGLSDAAKKMRRCNNLISNGSRCSVMLDAADPSVACDLCVKGAMHV